LAASSNALFTSQHIQRVFKSSSLIWLEKEFLENQLTIIFILP